MAIILVLLKMLTCLIWPDKESLFVVELLMTLYSYTVLRTFFATVIMAVGDP